MSGSSITGNLKTNYKSFYSYLRSKMTIKDSVTSLLRTDGTKTSTAEETASELGNFFSSVFTKEPFGPLPQECYKDSVQVPLETPTANIADVQKSLLKLNI